MLVSSKKIRGGMSLRRAANIRSSAGATEMAQFPLTIYCLFLIVLIPVLNLVAIIIGGCTAYLATNDLVAKSSTQPTFSQALNAMATEAYAFQNNKLAQFVKMTPQGGYAGCGNDLYILQTNVAGSGVQSSSPDQSLNSNFDTSKFIYEMQVVSSYSVSPIISMSSIPMFGSVPGLGEPVVFSFAASRPIEHPGGMQTAASAGSSTNVAQFNRTIATTSSSSSTSATSGTWRTPNIYQLIQNSGQTVLSENVFVVPCITADTPNNGWIASGVSIQSGQNVWIDTQAVGTWTTALNVSPPTDANGESTWTQTWIWAIDNVAPGGALIGWIGTNPPFVARASGGLPGASNMFSAGDTTLNYAPTTSGPLYMIVNDNWRPDNDGEQMVRIIVTR